MRDIIDAWDSYRIRRVNSTASCLEEVKKGAPLWTDVTDCRLRSKILIERIESLLKQKDETPQTPMEGCSLNLIKGNELHPSGLIRYYPKEDRDRNMLSHLLSIDVLTITNQELSEIIELALAHNWKIHITK